MKLPRFAGRALALMAALAVAAFAVPVAAAVSTHGLDFGAVATAVPALGASLFSIDAPSLIDPGLASAAMLPAAAMRAKFAVTSVTKHSDTCETIAFNAVCKSGGYPEDGTDEDNTYAKWTPSASCSIQITNPALVGKFEPGQKYYVDFSPAS